MKFGTVSPGRYTGADRYTGVAVGRRSTVFQWCVTGLECKTVCPFDEKSRGLSPSSGVLSGQHPYINNKS